MAALSPVVVLVTVVALTLPWGLEVHAQGFCRLLNPCNDRQTDICFNAADMKREYQCRRPADCGEGEPRCFRECGRFYPCKYAGEMCGKVDGIFGNVCFNKTQSTTPASGVAGGLLPLGR